MNATARKNSFHPTVFTQDMKLQSGKLLHVILKLMGIVFSQKNLKKPQKHGVNFWAL